MTEVKKSIVVIVDKGLWRRFKSTAALRDKKIGDLVMGWIKEYVREREGNKQVW